MADSKDLEVIIRGHPNSGKTTLACTILRALQEFGAEVTMIDTENTPTASLLKKMMKETQTEVLSNKRIKVRVIHKPRYED